jgi:hypothetical protein
MNPNANSTSKFIAVKDFGQRLGGRFRGWIVLSAG